MPSSGRLLVAALLLWNHSIPEAFHQPLSSSFFSSSSFETMSPRQRLLIGAQKPHSTAGKMTATENTSTDTINDTSLLQAWVNHHDESFHFLSEDQASEIRDALLTWYRAHRRMLPWRGDPSPWDGSTADFHSKQQQIKTKSNKKKQTTMDAFVTKKKKTKRQAQQDGTSSSNSSDGQQEAFAVTGYGVWVSEIMLQQTRVEAVIPYWTRWMKAFPTVADLAKATEDEINASWAGLGFYRRARLLHQAAKMVVNELNGELPQNVNGLLKLPGIGKSTASAIASIAYNVTVPVVDGNVCRVLSRLRAIAQHVKAPSLKDKWAWTLAAQIVEAGDGSAAGEVNQALMELGATYCSPSGTGVQDGDPLQSYYWSTRVGREFQLAIQTKDNAPLLVSLQSIRSEAFGMVQEEEEETPAKSTCPICASDGVSQVVGCLFNSFNESTQELSVSEASKCGHLAFPLAPPKAHKKEEVFAVGVISCKEVTTGSQMWLLTRRPEKGLLAGQWEFPSALVWTSETATKAKGKRKDMSDQVPKVPSKTRREALNSLLEDVGSDANGMQLHNVIRTNVGNVPLEHVFSHVRHTMWIEHGLCSITGTLDIDYYDDDEHETTTPILQWVDRKGREVRWMRECDMEAVGITSGVKKVLNAVKQFTPAQSKRRRRI